ncbi:NADP-dependent phosphogluconate dehydrogenase [Litoribacter alkaliphilus]|uniref:6-phosphogluconate dehydrogenase, decarboxylating n=1 Tax=Litoribacter ruber TaxID=702568 RepID=A0AAP2CK29_9BACT|nr:NADP-dependent phosphogluconate dehydrogenase [Litoribacter alkaliphilus]MBS9525400.1 NADP-dependent phosphogluconate dehydrogenase [Litoribacter alkaliphilus]
MIIIVFGVSGCGKTTVGQLLAEQLNLPFHDADLYHPPVNVAKMSNGEPLTDQDRIPWLKVLASNLREWDNNGGAVLACSALKEDYRQTLAEATEINWVYLAGSYDTIRKRLVTRMKHFMNPKLLDSQFEILEEPDYGIRIEIDSSPHLIVQEIMDKLHQNKVQFGIIGMGVMGRNLALNLAEKGETVCVYNRHVVGSEEGIAQRLADENPDLPFKAFDDLKSFVHTLEAPRVILLMIPAGNAVDMQIEQLKPLLSKGDVIVDGGNSFFKDSERRASELKADGFHFLPMGISGGEEGARKGPSLMPGGTAEGYNLLKTYLEKIAAVDKKGKACITHVGTGGAGHFVKMVHNSIEYAEMQLLAEIYSIMRHGWGLEPEKIAAILEDWAGYGLNSYLLEITVSILKKKENEEFLLDKILDQAEQKGTGGWSVSVALENGVPYGPLAEAVMARNISARKTSREDLAKKIAFKPDPAFVFDEKPEILRNAFAMVSLINHAVGFDLIKTVSDKQDWGINLSETARIWTNGCIIRSALMEDLVDVFKDHDNLLAAKQSLELFGKSQRDLAFVVNQAMESGHAVPVMSSALNYYLSAITSESAANLIQAQRDFFGAHTYQRKDKERGNYFHTDWLSND